MKKQRPSCRTLERACKLDGMRHAQFAFDPEGSIRRLGRDKCAGAPETVVYGNQRRTLGRVCEFRHH